MVSLLQAVVTGGGGGGYYPKPDFHWLPSWTMLPKGGLHTFGRLTEGLTGGAGVLPHPGAPAPIGAGAVVSGLGTAGAAVGAATASSVGATIASSVGAGEVAAIASGVGASGSGAVADAVAGVGAGGLMPAVSDVGDAIASALETGGSIPAVGISDVGVLPAVSISTPVAAATVGTKLMTSGTSLESILPILLPSIGIGLLKGLFLAELLMPKKKGKSYGYSGHYNQRLGQDFPEEYLRAPDIIREQQEDFSFPQL